MSSARGKRTAKPMQHFTIAHSPAQKRQRTGKADKRKGRRKRNRNTSADVSGAENPYDATRTRVRNLLTKLRRDAYQLDVYREDASRTASSKKLAQTDELAKLEARIAQTKKEIRAILKDLTEMNSSGPRWDHLEPDEDGQIELEEVACTACGSDESNDGNDIVLCDMAGCFRAYHQGCLRPPMAASVFEENSGDWFCWQCECLLDCLEMVENEVDGRVELTKWQEVFPECEGGAAAGAAANGTAAADDDDDDPSSDEDYDPAKLRAKAEAKSAGKKGKAGGSKAGSSAGGSGSDGGDSSDSGEESGSGGGSGGSDDSDSEGYNSVDTDTSLESIGDGNLEVAVLSDVSLGTSSSESEGGSGDDVSGSEPEGGGGAMATIGKRVNARRAAGSVEAKLLADVDVSGEADVGRQVARVRKGFLQIGAITGYDEGAQRWQCKFRAETVALGREKVVAALRDAVQEELRLKAEGKKAKLAVKREEARKLLEKQGKLDEANILSGARVRKAVDYVALNDALFGAGYDAEIDDGDDAAEAEKRAEAAAAAENEESGGEGEES